MSAMYRLFLKDRRVLPVFALGIGVLAAASSLEPLYRRHLEDESDKQGLTSNFHFARRFAGEPLPEALARHEHYLYMHLPMRRGMKILEIGCGAGARARQLAHFCDATVVGVDADASNIKLARACARNSGLGGRVHFLQVPVEDLLNAFEDNSFDAVFSVESVSGAHLEAICSQAHRILKPGAKFAFYRWCMSDAWNPSLVGHRQVHQQLTEAISPPDCPIDMPSIEDTKVVLQSAGFTLLQSEDLGAHADNVPWYRTLEQPTGALAWAWWRQDESVNPEYASRSILKAGKLGLFTPMALFVSQKD